jgi:hypothetical protein
MKTDPGLVLLANVDERRVAQARFGLLRWDLADARFGGAEQIAVARHLVPLDVVRPLNATASVGYSPALEMDGDVDGDSDSDLFDERRQ